MIVQPTLHRQDEHRRDSPPLSGVPRRLRPRRLAPLSLDLLRLSAPHHDPVPWRAGVIDIYSRYSAQAITLRLKELADSGYITDHGTPRTGWLTPRGQAAFARVS